MDMAIVNEIMDPARTCCERLETLRRGDECPGPCVSLIKSGIEIAIRSMAKQNCPSIGDESYVSSDRRLSQLWKGPASV